MLPTLVSRVRATLELHTCIQQRLRSPNLKAIKLKLNDDIEAGKPGFFLIMKQSRFPILSALRLVLNLVSF